MSPDQHYACNGYSSDTPAAYYPACLSHLGSKASGGPPASSPGGVRTHNKRNAHAASHGYFAVLLSTTSVYLTFQKPPHAKDIHSRRTFCSYLSCFASQIVEPLHSSSFAPHFGAARFAGTSWTDLEQRTSIPNPIQTRTCFAGQSPPTASQCPVASADAFIPSAIDQAYIR